MNPGPEAGERLPAAFFSGPPDEVAPQLLGCELRSTEGGGQSLRARIVEVEAYLGVGEDAASHAHRGRTARNSQMFATCGRLYVYFTYGMHHCANVVCGPEGTAGAILLRAAEPLVGHSVMSERRGRGGSELCNGPAKLCQAFALDLSRDGEELHRGPLGFWWGPSPSRVDRSGRIGISKARELPLRFFDADSSFLSRGRPAAGSL